MNREKEKYVTQEMIRDFLYHPCNAEKNLKSYYQITGQNLPLKTIYEEPEKKLQTQFGYTFNTDLRCINEKNYVKLKESLLFSETDWIHPFSDVAIHKHIAYMPAFRHHHAFYELCYVLLGQCRHTIYTAAYTQSLELQEGDFLILPPGVEHEIEMNSESSVVNILLRQSTFKTTFLHNIPANTPLYDFFLHTLYDTQEKNFMVCHTSTDPVLINLFFDIAEEYCNNDAFSNNIINQELTIFFSKLLRRHSMNLTFGNNSEKCLEMIPSILQYIESNYAETNVQDISQYFGFNAAYLSKLFKQRTNHSLIDTLIQTRIKKSQILLSTTNQPIEIISAMVGYSDTTYFIRKFKQITGYTPLQYRKNNKRDSEN